MKKKLLILSSDQFGYLTDTLKYCQYAVGEFEITYMGWDYSNSRIESPGVSIKYISRKGNIFQRNLRLLRAFHREIQCGYHAVFANYFHGVSILRLLNNKINFIVDIRTMCVNKSIIKRFLYNLILLIEIKAFKNISVISEGVANKLKLKGYYLLPLGGECFTSKSKTFEKLSLLYVGTLRDRNLIDCVKGFHLYLKSTGLSNADLVFSIVGDSPFNELKEINEYISIHNLSENIITHGAIPQSKLKPFFDKANVGISYIPLRSYYKYQPPTKTFEYLISGLPVLATATDANASILNGYGAGILIQDNPESFCSGLKELLACRHSFDSDYIKKSFEKFKWEELVKTHFVSMIRKLS